MKQKRSAISMNISPRTHDMGSRSALSACVYTALVLLISFVSRFMAVSHISRAGMYQTVQQTSFEITCTLGGIGMQTVSAASRLKYARTNLLSGIANAVASIPSEHTNTANSKNISIVCA